MCICVRLQDPDKKPTKADPKYFEKARVALLKKVELGQHVTLLMLQKEVQRLFRRDYKAWHKRVHSKKVRAKKVRAKQPAHFDMALLLTALEYGAVNIDTWSSPPPLENSWPRAHSPPPSACQLPLARSPEKPSPEKPSPEKPSPETPSSYFY